MISDFLDRFTASYAWDFSPAKRHFRNSKVVNAGMLEGHRLALTMKGVIDRSIDDDEGLQSSNYETYQIFEADDLVFKLIDLENIKTSRVGYVPRRGIMSPAYIRLSKLGNKTLPRYYYWFFYSVYVQNIFNGLGGGVRQTLSPEELLKFPIPLPDLPTQRAIADFLDRETARIDLLIEKKEKMVEVLGEKTSLQVEKSLNESFTTKWRLRHVGRIKNGAGFPIELQGNPNEEIPFFKVKHLAVNGLDRRICDTEDTISTEIASALRATVFPEKTIIFAKIGAALLLGRFSMLGVSGCIDNNCAAFIVKEHIADPDYVLLNLSKLDMRIMVQPGAVPSLNTEVFMNQILELPKLDEQKSIVSQIRTVINNDRLLINKIVCSIEHLREYRSSLITAAVTGQIDINDWQKAGAGDRRLDALQERLPA